MTTLFSELMSSHQIKQLCTLYNIKPRRNQGQNFLIDQNILKKIIQTADLKKEDIVLEVGAGFGVLTKELAAGVKKVIAVEQDKKLFAILKKELADFKNIILINNDIFKINTFDFGLLTFNFKIVANIPYNITSLFLRNFLSQEPKPKEMTLLVQKEVAQRIIARPPEMSLLAVSVQYYSQPKIISLVSKNCFWPIPAVDSVILKITGIKESQESDREFFKLVKIGFSSKRKQLQNNLVNGFGLSKPAAMELIKNCGFKPMVRAQELAVDDWHQLNSELNTLDKNKKIV